MAKIGNRGEFNQKMKLIHKRLSDTRPLMKALAIQTHKWILENYRTSGGKLRGRKWPSLKPSTVAARRRGSSKPLLDTGGLMRGWNWVATRIRAVIGHPSDIAVYHEQGTGIYGPTGRRYIIRPKAKKALAFAVAGAYSHKGKRKKRGGMAVVKYVVHPGIRKRRQLPIEDEIMPDLNRVADIWLKKVAG